MIIDSKNNVPLHNQNVTKIIDDFEYNTALSELVGHKLSDDKGLDPWIKKNFSKKRTNPRKNR